MSAFSPEDQFDALKKKVSETYKKLLDLDDGGYQVKVGKVYVDDTKDSGDIAAQRKAIMHERDWKVPIKAQVTLYKDGKKREQVVATVGHLPRMTERFGYIIKGNEYQSMNLLRLRPGVYHRRAANGKLYSEFNLGNRQQFARGRSFKIHFDQEKAQFNILSGTMSVPLLPMLKDMGMSDEKIRSVWGDKIFEMNKGKEAKDHDAALKKIYKMAHGTLPKSSEEGRGLFKELLEKTEISKETTAATLGKGFDKVNGDALLRSTKRLLSMSKGEDDGDDKGSLRFLSIHSADDLIANRLKESAYRAKKKMVGSLRRGNSLKASIPVGDFDKAIFGFFNTSLATQGDQTNPLEMLSEYRKTTLMGEQGGIKSSFAILEDSKLVNPSHLGFLDPIQTPEGEKTGVSLALSIGAKKSATSMQARFINAKTNKVTTLKPDEALSATVALPDQYTVKKGKRVARKDKVQALRNGEILHVKPSDVDYILPSPRGVFSVASNLIPFLQNNQGNRAMTAVRQQAQAVPLVNREAPLVQVSGDSDKTFEDIIGKFSSAYSPVEGTVDRVSSDEIVIKKGRKRHKVPLYRNFPLKAHTVYDSDVKVKKGDKVRKGQLVADTNFTKDGKLSLGTNLFVAYMPFKGLNFEDGLIISESAAKKLTSEHIYPKGSMIKGATDVNPDIIVDRRKFVAAYPATFKKDQVENIGDDGIIKKGSTVNPGDPLVLKLRRPSKTEWVRQRKKFAGGRTIKFRDKSLVWDKDHQGTVTDIVKKADGEVVVYVKTKESAVQGDKLVGRHGNKGIITRVIPDGEMPFKTVDGKRKTVDIVLNPLGVPGRINLGQVLETAAGKIADKTGKVYKVKNFEPGKNYLESVKKDLAKAGLEDKETLLNPDTGKPYEQKVLLGNQYILKLKHQVQKKLGARSGGPGSPYNINHAPTGGSPHGGSTLGELGLYAMLAHGARKNIHEMFAYKTNKNDELWDALRDGTPLPAPKVPFAYKKFLGYLNSLRVNVKKEGNTLQLVPFTEAQITGRSGLSNGELKRPGMMVRGKDVKEIEGGLFDPKVTGGLEGENWSHFKLAEAMPNPLFEDAIQKVLDISKKDFNAIVAGTKRVEGKAGGEAIEHMLSKVNVQREMKSLEKMIKTRKRAERDKAYKKLKILRALDQQKLDPTVYMMKSVPVLPPMFRPLTVKENGDFSSNDLNGLYKDVGAVNDYIKEQKAAGMPGKFIQKQRESLYNGLKAVMGMGGSLTRKGEYKGVLDIISGKTRDSSTGQSERGGSKNGFFHQALLKRRQDFSARSTIIPEPRMGLDEVGLPEGIAWTLYRPFIEKKLKQTGMSTEQAVKNWKKKTPIAEKSLNMVIKDKPVLLKRDPALHKFNIMAFKPRLVRGKAIQIHPLTVSGYNADFDGDTMAVYLPITEGATKEAYKMFPSNNLFSPTTGAVQYTPGHEALLGLYLASTKGKNTGKSFATAGEAQSAFNRGRIGYTDVFKIKGKETTVGRLEIESALPPELRETGKKSVSQMRVYDKSVTKDVLTHIAKKHPKKYGAVANKFKDIGNKYSTDLGYSIGLDDFSTVNTQLRDRMIAQANADADRIRRTFKDKRTQYSKIVKRFQKVDDELDAVNRETLEKNPTNIWKMVRSGARGKPSQLKQIVSTPLLLKDAKDNVIPYLVPKSYSEGMDIGSYWTTMHGARKGTIQKVQGVRDPGYISKQIQHSVMNTVVSERDCGTSNGITLDVSNLSKSDLLDRYVAGPQNFRGLKISGNSLVTPDLIASARKGGAKTLRVRSALRCESANGVCQMCAGRSVSGETHDIGTNVGVMSAHAIGEPSVQLSMNAFHTGGLAKGRASQSQSMFKQLSDLLRLPANFPNAATLSSKSGKVTKIKKAPQGGSDLFIGDTKHFIPEGLGDPLVKPGDSVKKGDALSPGVINPLDLLGKTDITRVQDQLTKDVHDIMTKVSPVKRRNVEVVVKAMTNITQIEDPGGHPDLIRGDIVPSSKIRAWNREHAKRDEVEHRPIMKGINVLPHVASEDWMARLGYDNIGRTVVEASREGWKTNIHGFHPIPAAAFAKEFGIKSKIGVKDWKGEY